MNNNELISVIVPIYNVERYLRRCVNSILDQTYQNIEVILVDDGSTDSSSNICDTYKLKDNRIKVIHKENGGLSDARNVGIEYAIGEYIAFIDSDDYIDARYLELLLASLRKNDADMAICNFKNVDEKGHGLYIDQSPICTENLTKDQLIYKYTLSNGYYYVVAWNKLYKRSVIGDIRFPKGKLHEDEFTCFLFAHNCQKIACIDDFLYFYVRRESGIMGSLSNTVNIKQLDRCEAKANRLLFQYEHGLNENINELFLSYYYEYESLKRKLRKISPEKIAVLDNQLKKISKDCYSLLNEKNKFKAKIPGTSFYLSKIYLKIKNLSIFRFYVNREAKQMWNTNPNSIHKKLYDYQSKKNKIFLVDTPIHGNLGDHAITVAEKRLLNSLYPNAQLIELLHNDLKYCKKDILALIKSDDVLYVHGGGFIGSLWKNEHDVFIDLLKNFKTNKIIVFPQTVFFNKEDKKLLKEFMSVLNDCSNLTMLLRDKQSFNFMKSLNVCCNLQYSPDVVMTLPYDDSMKRNDRILLCLRHDKEKVNDFSNLIKVLNDNNISYDYTDTVIDKDIFPSESKDAVYKKLNEFASYKMVICDRLHGMIFSAITDTPCIAFDNISKKVSGVNQWMDSYDFIKVFDRDITIDDINRLLSLSNYNYGYIKYEEILMKYLK